MTVCGLSLHQGSTENRKTLEQKFIFQIGTLNPNSINERFSFNKFIQWLFTLPGTNEWLTLETSAFESLYGGQFILSTQLIKPNYLICKGPDCNGWLKLFSIVRTAGDFFECMARAF